MTDADTFGFEQAGPTPRSKNTKPSESPEQRIIRTAIEVSLLYKGQEIHLRNLNLNEDDGLVGEVSGFSNICARQFEGITLGQRLSFRYQHIQHLTRCDA